MQFRKAVRYLGVRIGQLFLYPEGASKRYGTKGATMKKVFFDDAKMKVIGKKNFKGEKKMIDFYLITPGTR